jgi:hypothetical protein
MKKYRQTKQVRWLDTPIETIWVSTKDSWIQPEDEKLRFTLLGVDLDLLIDTDEEFLFEPIKEIE